MCRMLLTWKVISNSPDLLPSTTSSAFKTDEELLCTETCTTKIHKSFFNPLTLHFLYTFFFVSHICKKTQLHKTTPTFYKDCDRLTIKAEILGKRLCTKQFQSLFDEISHGPCISVWITTRKTLIGEVEKWEQMLPLNRFSVTHYEATVRRMLLKRKKVNSSTLKTSAIRFHWSCVGSMPVGLCAQPCRIITALKII